MLSECHALLLRQLHKAFPVQPQPLEMGRALVDLQHVLLHVVGHLALRVAGQQLFHIIGRVRGKGLAHKTSVGAQVAVELEQQGEKGRAAPAIGQEVEPVQIDRVPLIAQREEIIVRLLGDLWLGAALPHTAGGWNRCLWPEISFWDRPKLR